MLLAGEKSSAKQEPDFKNNTAPLLKKQSAATKPNKQQAVVQPLQGQSETIEFIGASVTKWIYAENHHIKTVNVSDTTIFKFTLNEEVLYEDIDLGETCVFGKTGKNLEKLFFMSLNNSVMFNHWSYWCAARWYKTFVHYLGARECIKWRWGGIIFMPYSSSESEPDYCPWYLSHTFGFEKNMRFRLFNLKIWFQNSCFITLWCEYFLVKQIVL